jgi:hypothetical protein
MVAGRADMSPAFVGRRTDKPAWQVVREREAHVEKRRTAR